MKYIKTYEGVVSRKAKKDNKYKRGDYVIVTSDDERLENDLAIVMADSSANKLISVELPEYVGEYLIYPHEIIKKLTPEEIEAIKYNL